MIFPILFAFVFLVFCSPYMYSCITWNYSLLLFGSVFMYTNFILYTILAIIYFMLPGSVIRSLLLHINKIIRNLFPERIADTEENIRQTFKMKVLYPMPQKSINIWHPHGISGVTPVIHNGYRVTDIPGYTPTKGVVYYYYFMMPIIKDIIRLLNAVPSDYRTIKETVQKESLSITIGGLDEMGRTAGTNIQLVIKKRTGIFKIALETGTPLVPVLTYGETEVFPETTNAYLLQFNEFMYSTFRMKFPFPTLTSVSNWLRLGTLPLKEIKSYTGKPIIVKKIENPTNSQITKLRKIYIRRVQELFDQTNPGGYTLEII
jgi:1-acyl-sn-glycerol-3-phosphate acyltransferase